MSSISYQNCSKFWCNILEKKIVVANLSGERVKQVFKNPAKIILFEKKALISKKRAVFATRAICIHYSRNALPFSSPGEQLSITMLWSTWEFMFILFCLKFHSDILFALPLISKRSRRGISALIFVSLILCYLINFLIKISENFTLWKGFSKNEINFYPNMQSPGEC